MKSSTLTAAGTFRPRADKKTAYRRLTQNIGGQYGLHSQAAMNSNDHGATQIWLTVGGRGADYSLTFLDDGIGMNKERRARFMDLGFTNEASKGYGYQGLGTKRMDADFAHCKVETMAVEEPGKLWTWEFDFDTLIALLADESASPISYYCEEARTPTEVAALAARIGLPAGKATGTRITLTQSREEHVSPRFTAETLRKSWAERLDPWVAKKIMVNGLPLRERLIHGSTIEWDDSQARGSSKLGLVRVRLYVPKNRSDRDEFNIGAVGPICSWQQFIKEHVPDELWSDDLHVLGEVFGCIYCDGLKRFIAASRDNFEVRLSTSEVLQEFLQYLLVHVVPEVRKVVGEVKEQVVGAQEEQLLEDLHHYLDHLSDGRDVVPPPPVPPRLVLQVDPTSMELCPGETARIVASRYDPNLTLKWDTTNSGGDVAIRENGWEVRYKAGKVAAHCGLVAYYKEAPATRVHVDITIVPKKVLRIEPHRFKIAFGREARLHVLNADVASSGARHIRWRLATDDAEGRFVYTVGKQEKVATVGYGLELKYRAGNTPGTFRIEAFDNKNRRNVACSDVTVGEPPEPTGGGKRRRKDVIVVGGCPYKVSFTDNQLGFLLRRLSPRHTGDPVELYINRLADAYVHVQKHRGRDGVFELCMNQILFQHVLHLATEDERLQPDILLARVAELYNKMVDRLKGVET